MFGIFSDINTPEEAIYDHIKDNIYKPLALKTTRKENIGDTLNDLINPKEKDSMIKNLNFESNYGVLETFMMKNFDSLLNLPEKMYGDQAFI